MGKMFQGQLPTECSPDKGNRYKRLLRGQTSLFPGWWVWVGDDGNYNRVGTTSLPSYYSLPLISGTGVRSRTLTLKMNLSMDFTSSVPLLRICAKFSQIFFFFALIKGKSRDFLISSKDFVNQRRYKSYWPRLSKKLNLSKTAKLMLLCFVFPASFFCNILSSLTIFCSSHSLLFQYFVLMVSPQLHFQRLSSRKKNSKLFTPHCDVCNHKVSIHPLSSV